MVFYILDFKGTVNVVVTLLIYLSNTDLDFGVKIVEFCMIYFNVSNVKMRTKGKVYCCELYMPFNKWRVTKVMSPVL